MNEKTMPTYLTTKELRTKYRISQAQIYRLVSRGILKPYRFHDKGRLRFDADEVEALLRNAA